ncbi:hypothetical protein LXL04_037601 [Taraxacum kok-saghyz]
MLSINVEVSNNAFNSAGGSREGGSNENDYRRGERRNESRPLILGKTTNVANKRNTERKTDRTTKSRSTQQMSKHRTGFVQLQFWSHEFNAGQTQYSMWGPSENYTCQKQKKTIPFTHKNLARGLCGANSLANTW